ncbi:SAM-dependent methyltransferase [Breznakia sp. PF5-3]|uniref:class I SAM-dependent methyltransferase n=1 Tax=unclassified Breznakia TaxID=2623764 RepID=UPI0024064C4B|nr:MULTISPECIES: class I SAM-dependent methyltransferase [unclassified Breznakia]MDF9824738.1 SAM-dependent methyltransferase [Breznakia sp. PM6-1]MDF9835695.1 SAM-dependent methyltransferase [Breznakia sp. PF5-3]MDF9837744.1 SAM-dependent methyltransferase [Breznakia sp. PFB2-8]MDF9859705.1 SAM-dependent methyltransferase [Breznakia sp. PH5-24]
MNKKLIDIYKDLPFPYQKSNELFWDDEYISKQMLKAHLDKTSNSASRNLKTIIKSTKWILSLNCRKQNPMVLDLGCGPGIYTEQFYNLGCKVTGVDFSKRSITYAKQVANQKGLNIDYLYQDYLTLSLKQVYDIITMIYCDYGVLNLEERKHILTMVYENLVEKGVFVFDVFTKANYLTFKNNVEVTYEEKGFWRNHPYVCIKRNHQYDNHIYLEQYLIVDDQDAQYYNIWNTSFSVEMILEELSQVGFIDVTIYADCTGKKYHKDSETICIVARKK